VSDEQHVEKAGQGGRLVLRLLAVGIVLGVLCVPLLALRLKRRHSAGAGGTVKLNNDAIHAASLEGAYANRPAMGAGSEKMLDWYYLVAHAESRMRHYDKAEAYYRKILAQFPDEPIYLTNFSVFLGKQGKYLEAEAAARKAISLGGGPAMHANMVLASWEVELGKKQAARARVRSVAVPAGPRARRLYYGCLACYHASAGEEREVAAAIAKALAIDNSAGTRAFFERDIIFDRYRDKAWFIELVGRTLASEPKK
jgi:predicted Zn-dependent protease